MSKPETFFGVYAASALVLALSLLIVGGINAFTHFLPHAYTALSFAAGLASLWLSRGARRRRTGELVSPRSPKSPTPGDASLPSLGRIGFESALVAAVLVVMAFSGVGVPYIVAVFVLAMVAIAGSEFARTWRG